MDREKYNKTMSQLVLPEAADRRIQNGIVSAIRQEEKSDVRKRGIWRDGARKMGVAMACAMLFFVSGITVFAYSIVNHKIEIKYVKEDDSESMNAEEGQIEWYDIEPKYFETVKEVEEYLGLDDIVPANLEEKNFRMVGNISLREAENQTEMVTMEFNRGNCEMVFIEITLENASAEGVVSLYGFEEGRYSIEETYIAENGIEWLILESDQSGVCTEVYSKYSNPDGREILYHISFGIGIEDTLMKEILDSVSIL